MNKKPRSSRLVQSDASPPAVEIIEWPCLKPMPLLVKAILDGIREVEPVQIPGRDGWWHVAETRISGGFNEPMARLEYSLIPAAS